MYEVEYENKNKIVEIVMRGPKGEPGNPADLDKLIKDINDIQNTYAAVGNTVSNNTGIPNPAGILQLSFVGTGDELLTPPISPQPLSNPDLNGYQLVPLNIITANGLLLDNGDGGMRVDAGGDGNYETPHAWLDMSSNTNRNNVGFIFGVHRGNQIFFSQRVTGGRLENSDDRTNISGGGFVENLSEGDILYVYGSSELTATVSIYDANLGLSMKKKN